jgi:hypothetical protein
MNIYANLSDEDRSLRVEGDIDLLFTFLKTSCGISVGTKRLEWRTEPPTEPGYYWACDMGPNAEDLERILQVAYISYIGDRLTCSVHGDDNWPMHIFTHWLGPLPEPELPKVEA